MGHGLRFLGVGYVGGVGGRGSRDLNTRLSRPHAHFSALPARHWAQSAFQSP